MPSSPGHYSGHYSGHAGNPNGLASRLLGFQFDYLWLGNRASVEKALVLDQIGGALEDQVPTGYNPSAWNQGLFRYVAGTDSWRNGVGDFASELLVVVAFRAQAPIGAITNLVSKREGSPNFLGWELFLSATGRLNATVDSNLSAGQTLGTLTDLVTPMLPQVVAMRVSPGLLELASVNDYPTLALNPGSFVSAADFSIGAQRLQVSPLIEIGLVGLVIDRPTKTFAPDLQQSIVYPIAEELVLSGVVGSEVVDVAGRDVLAWNPAYLP